MNGISAIPSAMQSAVSTIQRSQANLAKDAAVIANPAQVISKETVAALVDSRQQVLYSQAGAKLIAAADQAMQSVVDILA